MNKSFIFFLVATLITIFSIAVLNTGPIINNKLGPNWETLNCLLLSDEYDIAKDDYDLETDEELRKQKNIEKKMAKKSRDFCYREKAMYGLEYSAFILNIVIGFICSLLGLLHYLDEGKTFMPITGLIGLISGAIAFIISLIYLIYSILVYTKDTNRTIKTDEKGVYAKWDSSENAYICSYFEEENYYSPYANYNELGKKQYNYNKDLYIASNYETDSEIYKCQNKESLDYDWDFVCQTEKSFKVNGGKYDNCDQLYIYPISEKYNSDLNNRWLTTIILTVIIILCDACLAVMGFLLFKNKEESGEIAVAKI